FRSSLSEDEFIPEIDYSVNERGMTRTRSEADIVSIVEGTVLPSLSELGLDDGIDRERLQVHYRSTRGLVPYSYRQDLSFDEFAVFAENDFDVRGVEVAVKPQRIYPYDSLASHMIGYVKLPDIQKVSEETRQEFDHYVADDYGGAGIEKSMDEYLQGRAGRRVLRKDEKGIIRQELSYTPPKAGADVFLTIDAKLQLVAERAMRSIGRGAAVVMDPNTGDILAMVSVPSYNPNNFVPAIQTEIWNRYSQDKAAPMFNRALSDHPPGSTFKIPIALAGCSQGTDGRSFYCSGGVQYGKKYMQCWIGAKGGRHGSLTLSEAIKRSCNPFFYQYGNSQGIENIVAMTRLMGLGRKTGVPLDGESPGVVPSPQWLRLQGMLWSDAFTAMTSIGQGFAEATPLQMAWVTATVANGGKVYQPRLVKKIVEKDGTVLVSDVPELKEDLTEKGVSPAQIETIRRGMWKVVNESGGTAGRARVESFELSGKTGTAQTGKPAEPTDAWFISFAPYEEPQYAVAVFVHNGKSGGTCAAPIAAHIIKQAMAMQHGYDVDLVALKESSGHFDRVELVSFNDSGLEQIVEGDEADAAVQLPADFLSQVQTSSSQYHNPSINQRATSRPTSSSVRSRPTYTPRARKVPSRTGPIRRFLKNRR
ncbi:MAG: penicillin-binding protein 2, partial [Verrucomicrobiota bacterium]